MNSSLSHTKLLENGYAISNDVYSKKEVEQIITQLENATCYSNSSSGSQHIFAIRQLIRKVPSLAKLLFNKQLKEFLSNRSNSKYFLTKAIYFDKPVGSNWFVGYHQDLSISVDQKVDLKNYLHWTFKKDQYGVQPPLPILEDTITIRVHLDDTDKHNGALKVIPRSHLNGVVRIDSIHPDLENEKICELKKGGVMLMKPLTLHASGRTINKKQRRVIHLEFNTLFLKKPLNWLEYQPIT